MPREGGDRESEMPGLGCAEFVEEDEGDWDRGSRGGRSVMAAVKEQKPSIRNLTCVAHHGVCFCLDDSSMVVEHDHRRVLSMH